MPAYFINRVNKIRNPQNKIAWADSIGCWFRRSTSSNYIGETSAVGAQMGLRVAPLQGGVNIIFIDGHGEWRLRKQVDKTYLTTTQIDDLWFAYRM